MENMEKCERWDRGNGCNAPKCPLFEDSDLVFETTGDKKCPFRIEENTREVKFKGREAKTISYGGKVMSDELLKLVPEKNFKLLNKSSQTRWLAIK